MPLIREPKAGRAQGSQAFEPQLAAAELQASPLPQAGAATNTCFSTTLATHLVTISVTQVGTLTQSGVNEDFTALTPVEIQIARGRSITHWVRSSDVPVTFTVALKAPPLKVALDPHYAVLRK